VPGDHSLKPHPTCIFHPAEVWENTKPNWLVRRRISSLVIQLVSPISLVPVSMEHITQPIGLATWGTGPPCTVCLINEESFIMSNLLLKSDCTPAVHKQKQNPTSRAVTLAFASIEIIS
jgi:hypothetical protein